MRRVLPIAAALALAAACSDGTTGTAGGGRTQILLTDAPMGVDSLVPRSVARVDLFVVRIDASASTDTGAAAGDAWVTVAQPQRAFNLLELQNGTSALAGEADLPAGQYRAVRVVIDVARSGITWSDGSAASVHWPVAGQLALYALVESPLDVPPAGTKIVIDVDAGRTFASDGAGGFLFIPWLRAVAGDGTGSIGGTVEGPNQPEGVRFIAGAEVLVISVPGPGAMGAIVATTRTDDSGHYVFGFLRPGQYAMNVQPVPPLVFNGPNVFTTVSPGQRTTVNFFLVQTDSAIDTTGTGGPPPDTAAVASIALTPASQTVSVGDSATVMAVLRDAQGNVLGGRTLTWSSSDTTKVWVFATFGSYALLHAQASGTAQIRAASGSQSGSATVVVR